MPSPLGPLHGRSFAAVIFDMDGTLIDSIPVVIRSWLRWAEEHGLDPERLQGFHGVPAAAIVAELLPAHRHESALGRINDLELADTEGITVLPGSRGARRPAPGLCAIATSCSTPLAAVRIEATGLQVPRVLVTADDVERGKPPRPVPPRRRAAGRRRGAVPRGRGCPWRSRGSTRGRLRDAGRDDDDPAHELVADALVANLGEVTFSADGDGVRVRPRRS